jgi:molybdate transport system ATP-binding protein
MEVLERFGLVEQAHASPRELYGGQSQRVAVARAVATAPAALLLDEPLAALDASTRAAVRTQLRRNLVEVGGPRLLVTHDPVDAAVLADRLVILERGSIVQEGSVEDVSLRPASRFVADLVGVNLLHGTGEDTHPVRLTSGAHLTLADPVPAGAVSVAIRPRAIALHAHRPDGSPRNTWAAAVAEIEIDRDRARVRLDGAIPVTAEVTPASIDELALAPGAHVWASVKAVDLTIYERGSR